MSHEKIVAQHIKEFEIQEYVKSTLKRVGYSHCKLVLTPLGEKVVIYASRPGLIVGKRGQSIKQLTNTLKKRFNLQNPQIEINEVTDPNLDPTIIAERIANSLEKFGIARFKGIGHKAMEDVMAAGAYGIELIFSGKIPSSRAKRWRFNQGYLKKSGDIAVNKVRKAYTTAELKTGTVGLQVRIMTPDIQLPDDIRIKKQEQLTAEATAKVTAEKVAMVEKEQKEEKAAAAKPRSRKKDKESKEAKDAKLESVKVDAVVEKAADETEDKDEELVAEDETKAEVEEVEKTDAESTEQQND